MENKKISFGFLKTKKQEKAVITEQREYIESVEENAIKIIGKEVSQESAPLIIPMKPNTLITEERLREIAEKVENSINEPEIVKACETQNEPTPSQNETLDQMAVRELLQEAKQEKQNEVQSLKILVPSVPVLEGQKESSLDDYEAVPIQEFGMAMLRGMGWTPGKEASKYKQPNLRPKGLGLGADKVIKENQKNASKDSDKDLAIVKNACVKITIGKYNGCYGKVVSLDEDNGRVMVNIPVKKETVSLSEFMMQPVTKSEFDKQAKVINADSYEAYKKNELTQKSSKYKSMENESSSSDKSKYIEDKGTSALNKGIKNEDNDLPQKKSEKYANSRSKEKNIRQNHDSSSSEDNLRRKRREKKRYSSNESLSSDSNRRKKNDPKHHSSSDSEVDYKRQKSSSRKEKRDIDKKRKGKKKKRDRDRSPSHRKHRK